METRTENEARLRPWPEELTVEKVAAWILANCNAYSPRDAHPILQAMIDQQVRRTAQHVKSLKENLYV